MVRVRWGRKSSFHDNGTCRPSGSRILGTEPEVPTRSPLATGTEAWSSPKRDGALRVEWGRRCGSRGSPGGLCGSESSPVETELLPSHRHGDRHDAVVVAPHLCPTPARASKGLLRSTPKYCLGSIE